MSGFGEGGQEHRDVAVADVVTIAELCQGREEALTGIEPDTEGPAGGQLVAVHTDPALSVFRSPGAVSALAG